jgi:hypothetical protein
VVVMAPSPPTYEECDDPQLILGRTHNVEQEGKSSRDCPTHNHFDVWFQGLAQERSRPTAPNGSPRSPSIALHRGNGGESPSHDLRVPSTLARGHRIRAASPTPWPRCGTTMPTTSGCSTRRIAIVAGTSSNSSTRKPPANSLKRLNQIEPRSSGAEVEQPPQIP